MRAALMGWAILVCLPTFGGKISVETYGDSITSGFLSGTDVTHAPPLSDISKMLNDFVSYAITKNYKFIKPYHRPDLAWPVTFQNKLKELTNEEVELTNLALSGSESPDLLRQVSAFEAMQLPATEESFSFFFTGHNDLCRHEDTPQALAKMITANFKKAIEKWDANHKNSHAYIMPIADIHRVYSSLAGYVWKDTGPKKYGCKESWVMFPMCRKLAKKAENKTLEAYLVPRLKAINESLKDLTDHWARESETNDFHYIAAFEGQEFKPEFFAIDCFHLSQHGQNVLGESVYRLVESR